MLKSPTPPAALSAVIDALAGDVAEGHLITARDLEIAMEQMTGKPSSTGAWIWRAAYDLLEGACAKATLAVFRQQSLPPAEQLDALLAAARMVPTQTRRSEEQIRLQQFSTPLPYAFLAAHAAALTTEDVVLEPSAGTGCMAVFAQLAGATLHVNEVDAARCAILEAVTSVRPSAFDAALIDDRLDTSVSPSVVLMNPPFSSSFDRAHDKDMACRHLFSALKRLAPGGRLVAIMPPSFRPKRRPAFWSEIARRTAIRLHATVPGAVYRKHGTSVETVLVVIDKAVDAVDPTVFADAPDLHTLLDHIAALPPRAPVRHPVTGHKPLPSPQSRPAQKRRKASESASTAPSGIAPLTIRVFDTPRENAPVSDIYAAYAPQRIGVDGARPHPTPLVESLAMASVAPPVPTYRPVLPSALITEGALSEPQCEAITYAGDAHDRFLPGFWNVEDDLSGMIPAAEDDEDAVRFRTGYFIGDGTGCGKGREVAGIILDNWLQGRTRGLWISKSDKLIEDALRDWTDLGGAPNDIKPLSRWKPEDEITLARGVLFTTYATLRSQSQSGATRLRQIIDWLGSDFDGVIAFDEAHAMGSAAGGEQSGRAERKASLQGLAGLKLQVAVPSARIVYVSATGATTVENLAYATRLGLWGAHPGYPFPSREDFVGAMHAGGVAAMEVVARDLKSLGLYLARSLSFEGVEYDILDHALTPRQRQVYDAWADAFQIIHEHLGEALRATNVDDMDGKTNNGPRKSAVMSRFESLKQRFFNHLLTGMSTPAVIEAIRADLEAGHSAVIQIVSTGEALLNRRLEGLSEEERNDLNIDMTPREYVLDYLANAFPVQLQRVIEDADGNISTETVIDEATGRPALSREAMALREDLIERLAGLDAVPTAIDQLVWAFGTDGIAEITGRSKRPVYRGIGETSRLVIERRSASANTAETRAFMNGIKRVLVFSEAGGTGRSYHAAETALNQQRRIHYLLEPGWKADAAIQGLGRSHRSAQVSAPLFRVIATDVQGQKRFTSTIARRLDSLGALTKGQRQTGSQGLFREEDNLESPIARSSLRAFYAAIAHGNATSVTLERFETITALKLATPDGALREDLPPMSRFLNRILALRIEDQNRIFEEFGGFIEARVESARAAETLDVGLETILAERLEVMNRTVVRTCEETGSETVLTELLRTDRVNVVSAAEALDNRSPTAELYINRTTAEPVIRQRARSLLLDDGTTLKQWRLIGPEEERCIVDTAWCGGDWTPATEGSFSASWDEAVSRMSGTRTSKLTLITGLLLPIWKHLDFDEQRIWRATPETGAPLLGPALSAEDAGRLKARLVPTEAVCPQSILAALTGERRRIALRSGAAVKMRRVGLSNRIEIEDVPGELIAALKSQGCFTERIDWRTRVFIPFDEEAGADTETLEILDRTLGILPLECSAFAECESRQA